MEQENIKTVKMSSQYPPFVIIPYSWAESGAVVSLIFFGCKSLF
jgi:hypothetical protein